MTLFYRNSIALSLILLTISTGFCQTDSRARLAQALERNQNYEQSLEIYLELYKEGKHEFGVIHGIQKAYSSLKRYSEFISFQKDLLKHQPNNINYRVELGRAYFLNQQKEEAIKEWTTVLANNSGNHAAYSLVGRTMTELRLLDEAVEVYLSGLNKVKQKDLFLREIAAIRRAQLDYEKATEYLLEYYRANPKQKSYVRSQFTTMAKDDESSKRMLSVVITYTKNYPKVNTFLEFRALLHTSLQQFQPALAIYKRLKNINFYLQFANEVSTRKAYPYAVDALLSAMLQEKQTTKKNDISLRLAKTHYTWAKTLRAQNEAVTAQQQVSLAQDILTALASQNKDIRNRWLSLELSADIHAAYYRDYQQAMEQYQQILSDCKMIMISERVRLKLAEIYLSLNILEKADNQYQKIKTGKYLSIARFEQAQLEYYLGNFTRALQKLDLLQKNLATKDTLTNNILQKLYFIENFKTDSITLTLYSHAELLQRQHHIAQAAILFQQIFKRSNQLSVKAGLAAARLFRQIGNLSEADAILTTLVSQYPTSEGIDLGLLRLADLKKIQNNTQQAKSLYLKLISEYPSSFYTDQARENIRTLQAMEGTSEQ